jgi:hypothetical protein
MCGAQCCNVRCYDRGKVMVHCGAKHSQLCVVLNAAMCGVMTRGNGDGALWCEALSTMCGATCCNVRCYDRGKVMVHCGAKHSQLCVVLMLQCAVL